MNIRDLKYLIALSEYKHFGKAAAACFVSQPALSMQIKKLEESLGVQLLERTNKTVLLTAAGLQITERARKMLEQFEEMYHLAKLAEDPHHATLKIGIIPALSKKFQKVFFYLIEAQTSQLIDELKTGKLDAVFLASPLSTTEPSFSHVIVFKEAFLLAVPRAHPLAKRKTIQKHDLENERLFLLEEGHCMRDQTLSLCEKMDATESHDFRATSLETLRHMVAAGNGITFMPQLAVQKNQDVVYIPFSAPKPMRSIGLYWRSSAVKKLLIEEIADFIQQMRIV
jgi:LysR family hydrogen peroxide-inducible transcriptional activator